MRAFTLVLALTVLGLGGTAQALKTTRLLDASAPDRGLSLLDLGIAPGASEQLLLAGGGDGAARPLIGMGLAIGGTVALLVGAPLMYLGYEAMNSNIDNGWAGGIAAMGGIFGVVLFGGGVAALVASGFMLLGNDGSGGDALVAVRPPARAESDRLAKTDRAATPLAMAWGF